MHPNVRTLQPHLLLGILTAWVGGGAVGGSLDVLHIDSSCEVIRPLDLFRGPSWFPSIMIHLLKHVFIPLSSSYW